MITVDKYNSNWSRQFRGVDEANKVWNLTFKQILILKAELLLVQPVKVFISRLLFASSLHPFNCQSIPGELYFLATGAPSATTRAGFIYKIVDPSRYLN